MALSNKTSFLASSALALSMAFAGSATASEQPAPNSLAACDADKITHVFQYAGQAFSATDGCEWNTRTGLAVRNYDLNETRDVQQFNRAVSRADSQDERAFNREQRQAERDVRNQQRQNQRCMNEVQRGLDRGVDLARGARIANQCSR